VHFLSDLWTSGIVSRQWQRFKRMSTRKDCHTTTLTSSNSG